jgi:Tfp pilus assembly protein PilX
MHSARAVLKDERGIAVVVAVVALMTLTALVLAFLAVSAYEPQISKNLADSTRARYIAEAGLEAAYDTLVANTTWNNYIIGGTCTDGDTGVVMGAQNQAMPGLTSSSGTYTIRVRNDCQTNDATITGVTREANTTGAADGNNHLILTSTGTYGTATRTMTVVITRVANLLSPNAPASGQINASLSFPGYESDTYFTGNSFTVDGRNHDLSGNLTTGQALLGISVGPENQFVPQGGPLMHHEQTVQNSVSSQQQDNIVGVHETNPNATAEGNLTIAAGALTSAAVTDFVNAVKGYADITVNTSSSSTTTYVRATNSTTTTSGAASYNVLGSTCSSDINSPSCFGTAANPKVVYIKGTLDPTSAFNALTISGNSSGYGILIVEDGDFTINGNFQWTGPIIVTGGYVGVGINGGGNQQILGALISNETATNEAPGFYEGVLQGNAKVNYSRAALDQALTALASKVPGGNGGSAYVKITMYNFQEQ